MQSLVPTTPETRDLLAKANIETIPDLEYEAQAVLALVSTESNPDWSPNCYRKKFSPTSPVCDSCVLSARCWTADAAYLANLTKGQVTPPPGMPDEIIKRALSRSKHRSKHIPPRVE